MKTMTRALLLISALSLGCRASSTPPPAQPAKPSVQRQNDEAPGISLSRDIVGKTCRVSLRRDALGMSAPGFAEPMTPMIGGKPALLTGTVEQLTDNWLVFRDKSKTYWIPINAILMVETDTK